MPKVKHLDKFKAAKRPVTLVSNHVSRDDAIAVASAIPGKKLLVVPGTSPMAETLSRLPADCRVHKFDDGGAASLKAVIKEGLREGEDLLVFPETRISDAGEIGKLSTTAALLAMRLTEGRCVPLCITLGRSGKPEAITCADCTALEPPEEKAGGKVRGWQEIGLRQMLEAARFLSFDIDRTMPRLLVDSARRHGMSRRVHEQVVPERRKVDYRLLLRGSFALGSFFADRHKKGDRVGLMLPTAVGTAVTFSACHFAGIVPVMLNFGAGKTNLVSACATAEVTDVYTAKGLLDRLEDAREGAEELKKEGIKIHLLEEIRESLGLRHKLMALFGSIMPNYFLGMMPGAATSPSDEALVLFTSGSEGAPKGVVLSHRNIVANAAQVLSRIAVKEDDLLFNSLPLFHSFGMIGGLVLPVIAGLRTLHFPSPLMYQAIPALIQSERATIMFSTSTFFSKYGKHAHPSDMESLRLIVAGGEKLADSVRKSWMEKFGRRIHEGYGVTETSPALAVNIDQACKAGSIGLLLPAVEHSVEPVDGIKEGGKLVVGGPNVMTGYIFPAEPGVIKPSADGRHDTGDVVVIDDLGFVKIVGRVKRFAKVAGEMVPLSRVEEVLEPLFGDESGAVVAVPDKQRGEALVLVTQKKDVTREQSQALIKEIGMPELWAPREIRHLSEIPLLPTGKVNYPALHKILSEQKS